MAAQAALQAISFPAITQCKGVSKASNPPYSISFLQALSASTVLKVPRPNQLYSNTSARRVNIVVFASPSSDQMERSVSVRFENEATVRSEPFGEKQLKVNVTLTPAGTRKAFDFVLENLRKSAPPVQGFRRAKGGKSVIPRDVLYQMLGPSRVDSFVVEEIASSSVLEYVEKEGFKVKQDFETVQSNKELAAMFKAGKEFVFDAILSLEAGESEAASVEES